jgi:hypothetical protein
MSIQSADEESLDYWIKYYAFSADQDYKENPDYIEAQQIWSTIKCSLLYRYKDQPKVLEFIDNITPSGFYESDGCFTVTAFIKMNYGKPKTKHRYFLQDYHRYLTFIYDPIMLIQKQITLTDYDGFTYDMGMFLKYDYMLDTEDQDAIDKELYEDFIRMTGYKEVGLEDISTIFNNLLGKGWTKNNRNLLE